MTEQNPQEFVDNASEENAAMDDFPYVPMTEEGTLPETPTDEEYDDDTVDPGQVAQIKLAAVQLANQYIVSTNQAKEKNLIETADEIFKYLMAVPEDENEGPISPI